MGVLNWLFGSDKNKTNKRQKHKEQIGDKIITRTSYEAMTEKQQRKRDATCPECNHYEPLHGGITNGTYNFYTCRKCNCQWKVRKK